MKKHLKEYVKVVLEFIFVFQHILRKLSEIFWCKLVKWWWNDFFSAKIFWGKLVRCVNYNDLDCCVPPPLILSSTFNISEKHLMLNFVPNIIEFLWIDLPEIDWYLNPLFKLDLKLKVILHTFRYNAWMMTCLNFVEGDPTLEFHNILYPLKVLHSCLHIPWRWKVMNLQVRQFIIIKILRNQKQTVMAMIITEKQRYVDSCLDPKVLMMMMMMMVWWWWWWWEGAWW